MERTHEEATEALHAGRESRHPEAASVGTVPISELCDKHGLQPTGFYRWQKEFFENRAAAFQPKARPNHSAGQERIDHLEKKIQTKDEELMAEQFIAKDFKEFIRISGMTHVRTSPYYPQSNGKIERWHKSLKGECIRPRTPLSLDDGRRLVEGYVEHYNNVRLNSAVGYITPKDMLAGRQQEIHAERDRKLEVARKQRQIRRQQAA